MAGGDEGAPPRAEEAQAVKLSVRVGEDVYEAEVGDLDERPVTVLVDGERFEVWPEEEAAIEAAQRFAAGRAASDGLARRVPARTVPSATGALKTPRSGGSGGAVTKASQVWSPLPGVVVQVQVAVGDEVDAGRPLLVIEAMKMENVVRATRRGRVKALHVAVGEHVKHRQMLLEIEERD